MNEHVNATRYTKSIAGVYLSRGAAEKHRDQIRGTWRVPEGSLIKILPRALRAAHVAATVYVVVLFRKEA